MGQRQSIRVKILDGPLVRLWRCDEELDKAGELRLAAILTCIKSRLPRHRGFGNHLPGLNRLRSGLFSSPGFAPVSSPAGAGIRLAVGGDALPWHGGASFLAVGWVCLLKHDFYK